MFTTTPDASPQRHPADLCPSISNYASHFRAIEADDLRKLNDPKDLA